MNTAVVFAADQAYFPGLLVALHSLGSRTGAHEAYDVVVYEQGWDSTSFQAIERLKSLFFKDTLKVVPFSTWKDSVPQGSSRFPAATFIILALHRRQELMEYDRVIWIDADVLFLKSALPIIQYDIQGKIAGAVYDNYVKEYELKHLGIPRYDYYSSGLIIFDMTLLRRKDPDMISTLLSREDWVYPDQDVLNMMVPGKDIQGIPLGFNMFGDLHVKRCTYSRHQEDDALLKNITCLHIVGYTRKPWQMSQEDWRAVWGKSMFINYRAFDQYYRKYAPFLLKEW